MDNFDLPHWLMVTTLQGSIAILLISGLAPFLRRLVGARVAFLLWFVVLFRLLIPGLPAVPVPWPAPAALTSAPDVAETPAIHATAYFRTAIEPTAMVATAPAANPSRPGLVLTIWLAGVALILGIAILRSFRARRLVHRARDVSSDPVLLKIFELLAVPAGRLRLCETDELRSPALCGLFRPVILLPIGWERRLSAEELQCILLHEIGHFRRGDLIWRWAFLIARSIHWFNPLVWVAERLAHLHQEMACDEWVLRRDHSPSFQVYGEALLVAAGRLGNAPFSFPAQAGMAESKAGLKRRIRQLPDIRPRGWNALFAGLLVTGMLAILTGGARSASSPTVANSASGRPMDPPQVTTNSASNSGSPVDPKAYFPALKIESVVLQLPTNHAEKLFDRVGEPDVVGVRAVYSPGDFLKLLVTLQGLKGTQMVSTPKVIMKNLQHATIDLIREFPYPTEFEPPQTSPDKKVRTPATPTTFETKNLGIELEIQPIVATVDRIDLGVVLHNTQFVGFVDFGGSRGAKANLAGDALNDKIDPPDARTAGSVINQPIFSTRKISTEISMKSGETALIGGIEGTRDALHDLPFQSATTSPAPTAKSNFSVFIFVTATIVDGRKEFPLQSSAAVPPHALPPPISSRHDLPYAVPVPGKPGFASSPYSPTSGFVDLRGFPPDTKVKDPYTGKEFLVPAIPNAPGDQPQPPR